MGTCTSGIYVIRVDKYIYIGSAHNLSKRKSAHKIMLDKNNHTNRFLQNVYNKHKSFLFEVIEHCDISVIIEREQYYLDYYFLNYTDVITNICKTARSGAGITPSDETRAKLSKALMGNTHTKGKALSEDHKRKISEAGKQRIVSDETRRKITEANIKRFSNPVERLRLREKLLGKPKTKKG